MTSSVGIKTAVSDYEHLNRKQRYKYVTEKEPNDSSEDEDVLPLKSIKPAGFLTNRNVILPGMANINNSSTPEPEIMKHVVTNQAKLFDDMGQSVNPVPVPVAWSPGMKITSNPSLFITPQKLSINSSAEENFLEPESANKIPKPVAWSPGMKAELDPNLFITPEKSVGTKVISQIIGDEKENIADKNKGSILGVPKKTKEMHSVRFDLPSSTSGDETNDPLSDIDSPITLRGCDISLERQSFESPIWKTFSPQRMYNQNTYSDESSLDDSSMSILPSAKTVPKSASDSVSDNLSIKQNNVFINIPKTLTNVSARRKGLKKPYKETDQNLVFGRKVDTKPSISNLKPHILETPKSDIPSIVKGKIQDKVDFEDKSSSKAGPQFLSSPLSPYESPLPGSTVIREMKNNLVSKEYSFPFELRATTEASEYEHVFARPEFNSTLKVRAQLDTLCEQEVDVKKAIADTLAKSEVKRIELNEKAAVYTNRTSSQFKNLIDLNTPEESLCDRIVRMRTSKIPSKKRGAPAEKKSSESHKVPDLMEFFTSDLLKEYPDLTLPGVARVTSQPMTSPPDIAFDLYRHNRLWQGINDF